MAYGTTRAIHHGFRRHLVRRSYECVSVLGPRKLMAFDGRCVFGQVHYRLIRRFLNAAHCYCSICRRAHGTGFSTHVVFRPDQLRFPTGTLIDYESSPSAVRSFYPRRSKRTLIPSQSGGRDFAIPAGTLDGLPQHQGWPPGFGAAA